MSNNDWESLEMDLEWVISEEGTKESDQFDSVKRNEKPYQLPKKKKRKSIVNNKNIQSGMILSEILDAPRAKKPHPLFLKKHR